MTVTVATIHAGQNDHNELSVQVSSTGFQKQHEVKYIKHFPTDSDLIKIIQ